MAKAGLTALRVWRDSLGWCRNDKGRLDEPPFALDRFADYQVRRTPPEAFVDEESEL